MARKQFAFWRDQRGGVLITTGLAIVLLVAVAGASIDLGTQQLLRARTQQSSDAAALAAASLSASGADAQQVALRYFNLNFSSDYLGAQRPTPSISVGGGSIAVSATTPVTTQFTGLVGVGSVNAGGRSVVETASSATSNNLDYDVVAVIDESGSTGGIAPGGTQRIIEVEKQALVEMVNGIFRDNESNPNVRFGLVGYTGYISTMGGLTSKKSDALGYLNNLSARCQNYDHWGMEAGFKMINGNWNGFQSVSDLARDGLISSGDIERDSGGFSSTCPITRNTNVDAAVTTRSDGARLSSARHVVFITDGYIMVEPPPVKGKRDYESFVESCENVKRSGAIVYTISFVSQGPGDVDALKRCASTDPVSGSPRYFFAPDAATLRSILGSVIVQTVRSIRISE